VGLNPLVGICADIDKTRKIQAERKKTKIVEKVHRVIIRYIHYFFIVLVRRHIELRILVSPFCFSNTACLMLQPSDGQKQDGLMVKMNKLGIV